MSEQYRPDDIFQEATPENETVPEKNPPKEKRSGHIRILGMSLSFIVAIAYIGLSLWNSDLWARLWVAFLLVPVLDSIPLCFINKSLKYFQFSMLIVFSYLMLGMFFGIWHPTWILFFAIPVWETFTRGKTVRFIEFK